MEGSEGARLPVAGNSIPFMANGGWAGHVIRDISELVKRQGYVMKWKSNLA